jgi:opacity protein-like surface antigen
MKKLALAVAISTSALSAFAEDAGKDFYAQVNAGYAFGMNSNKAKTVTLESSNFGKTGKSMLVGLEGGARINEHFRLGLGFDYLPGFKAEGNAGTLTTNLSKTKISSMAFMVNAFLDAGDFSGFKPYVMIGAGVSKNKTKATTFTYNGVASSVNGASKTSFAYKLGLGTKFSVNEDIDLDVRYQFVDLGKFTTGTNYTGAKLKVAATGKLRSNQLMVGVAYKF